ncbi:MAG: hypothetical protein QM658_08995 [Gordonia sp. (in: high G+C Gram-positive bacteria)]
MPFPGPQDYGDVEPTPRSQAWSAQPDPATDRFGASSPGVFVPPPPAHPGQTAYIPKSRRAHRPPPPPPPAARQPQYGVAPQGPQPVRAPQLPPARPKEKHGVVWAVLALMVLVALAGVSWWIWRENHAGDPDAVNSASAVAVGDCVRVHDGGDGRSSLTKAGCERGTSLNYYVAAKVDGACQDRQYASFQLPEGKPSVLCLVPNLVQGRCYEVVPPGQTGTAVRTKDLGCGTTPTQPGAESAEVLLRRDGSKVDCPAGTTSEVVVSRPRPLQYCLRAVR